MVLTLKSCTQKVNLGNMFKHKEESECLIKTILKWLSNSYLSTYCIRCFLMFPIYFSKIIFILNFKKKYSIISIQSTNVYVVFQ